MLKWAATSSIKSRRSDADQASTATRLTSAMSSAVDISLMPLYVVVILAGVIGNSLVIAVIRKNRSMHTTANFLLANLALADLITLASCPPGLVLMFVQHPGGTLGNFMCKFVTKHHPAGVALLTSGFTLTLISVERYNALLKPMKRRRRLTKRGVRYAVVLMWLLAIVFVIPLFHKERFNETLGLCEIVWEDGASAATAYWSVLAALALTSFCTMAFCYAQIIRGLYFTKTICSANNSNSGQDDDRSKRKVVRLLLAVTAVFVGCFLPFVFASALPVSTGGVFYKLSSFLVYCSCCLNPVVYTSQSENYRRAFKKLLVPGQSGATQPAT